MQNPVCGTDPGMLDDQMSDLGEALDILSDARWHIELISMACRHNPDEDAKAVSAVTYTALERLTKARGMLEELWRYRREARS